jgi:hypothetical protein
MPRQSFRHGIGIAEGDMARDAEERGTRWGVPLAVRADACSQARAALLERAGAGATLTYSELAQAVSATGFRPRSWALMALLDEVCRDEDPVRGVWIASLVVRKDTGIPGDGYFAYAQREGFDTSDRHSFWRERVQRVWNAYAAREPGSSGSMSY